MLINFFRLRKIRKSLGFTSVWRLCKVILLRLTSMIAIFIIKFALGSHWQQVCQKIPQNNNKK